MSNRQPSPERLEEFRQRTDPLVLQAFRKSSGQRGHSNLTPEEKEALDAWLAPRIEALVDQMAAGLMVTPHPVPLGPSRRVKTL